MPLPPPSFPLPLSPSLLSRGLAYSDTQSDDDDNETQCPLGLVPHQVSSSQQLRLLIDSQGHRQKFQKGFCCTSVWYKLYDIHAYNCTSAAQSERQRSYACSAKCCRSNGKSQKYYKKNICRLTQCQFMCGLQFNFLVASSRGISRTP